MIFFYSDKTGIDISLNLLLYMKLRVFKKPEVMFLTVAEKYAYYTPCFFTDNYQCFYSMSFLFSRIPTFLLVFTVFYRLFITFSVFFGRSTGVSVASINIISYSASFLRRAALPGRRNVPSAISVFSTHFIIRWILLSCMP